MTTSPGHDPLHSAGPPATGATPAAGAGDVRTPPPTGDVRTPHATGTGPSPDAGIGELVSNITNDFSTLVRQELELAKAELSQTISKAGKGAGLFGGAGLAGYFTLLFLSLALWWALGAMIGDGDAQPALGWSALIVAAIWAVVAAVLAVTGRKEVQEAEGLLRTQQTVKKIPDAMKGQEHR